MYLNFLKLSVLVAQFNEIFSYKMLIRAILSNLPVPICVLCVLLRFHHMFNLYIFVMPVIMCCSSFVLFETMLIMEANVWIGSVRLNQSRKINLNTKTKLGYKKKLLVSLKPLKIKVGSNNVVETGTPLEFVSYNISKFATLMCIKI